MEPIVGLYFFAVCLLVYPLVNSGGLVQVPFRGTKDQGFFSGRETQTRIHPLADGGLLMMAMSLLRCGFVGNMLSLRQCSQHGFTNAVFLTVVIERFDEFFGFHTKLSACPWQMFQRSLRDGSCAHDAVADGDHRVF